MEITRKYHVADAVLLEFTGKELEILPGDIDKFKAFDPDLDDETVTSLDVAYKKVIDFGTDKSELGEVGVLTEKLSAEFENCISVFTEVRYFVKKRFTESSPATLKVFGLDKYWKARRNQPKMVLFMHEFAKNTEKYKSELIAAGLKEPVVASVKQAADALENSNVTQETGKDGRSLKAEDRIILLNNVYDILMKFSDAAKIVFATNKLKRDMYIVPYNRGGGGDKGTGGAPK